MECCSAQVGVQILRVRKDSIILGAWALYLYSFSFVMFFMPC